jgi:hypothetical protein
VPLGPFAVDLSGAGRLGDVIQAGGTAPPAVRAAFGEPLLSEHPQRDETAEGDSRAARATSAPRASAWSSTCSPAIKRVMPYRDSGRVSKICSVYLFKWNRPRGVLQREFGFDPRARICSK